MKCKKQHYDMQLILFVLIHLGRCSISLNYYILLIVVIKQNKLILWCLHKWCDLDIILWVILVMRETKIIRNMSGYGDVVSIVMMWIGLLH